MKQLLILLNILFLVFTNFLPQQEVTVVQNLPKKVPASGEFTVEVVINKENIAGFAKFQQDLPVGFNVTPIETKGASFTFNNQIVKLIWIALPEDSEFTISYKITLDENAPRNAVLSGKFAYLENNERKTVETASHDLQIGENDAEIARGPIEAKAYRTISKISEEEYSVTVKVVKNGLEGFAKIQETIPDGITAVTEDKKGSVFSFVGQKAKFVWMTVPQDKEIEVSYKIQLNGKPANTLDQITGDFSFLKDNQTEMVPIENAGGAVLATATEINSTEPGNNTTENSKTTNNTSATEVVKPNSESAVTKTENNTSVVAANEPKSENNSTNKTATSTQTKNDVGGKLKDKATQNTESKTTANTNTASNSAPIVGLVFRVQIAAGHKLVTPEYFVKEYKYDGAYFVDNHEGWIKYTTGAHPMYKEAKNAREAFIAAGHNFPGPFVTAYNEGKRITVQEALMISNQKWVQ